MESTTITLVDDNPANSRRLAILAAIFAMMVLALGIVVLVGWYIHAPALIQVHPNFVPMQYNTALGLALSGGALWALIFSWQRLAAVLGFSALLLGSVTLIQYIFGFDLAIDQLFMEHYIQVKTSHPGRMAPNTALCFTIGGATVLIVALFKGHPNISAWSGVLGSIITALGIVALTGYFIETETAYGWGELTRMAFHTAAGFVLFGFGCVTLGWLQETRRGHTLPTWIPYPSGIGSLTISLALWQAMNAQEAQLVERLGPSASTYADDGMLLFGALLALVITVMMRLLRVVRRRHDELEQIVGDRTRDLQNRTVKLQNQTNELEVQKQKAEEASRSKSAFLANMSHELRTPLNAILGFATLMQRERSLSDSHQQKLETITRSGRHLLGLINGILEISKIEAGGTTSKTATFDLHALLEDLSAMFRARAQESNLDLNVIRSDDMPQYIISDEAKLRQILINLTGNAVKFTETGGVVVRARTITVSGSWHLVVEVEDTGAGIADDKIAGIFLPFEQAVGGGQVTEGTGLGLTISQEYAHLLGGKISVDSHPGKGSLFRLEIGVEVGDASEAFKKLEIRHVIGFTSSQEQWRILVVDDKPDNRAILSQLLSSVGFVIREAGNGVEAVSLFSEWSPHLICMDIKMPELDGLEATRQIRNTETGQGIPIIAVSASVFEEQKSDVLAAGCNDFVRKPICEEEIFTAIERQLDLQFVYDESVPAISEIFIDKRKIAEGLAALPLELYQELDQALIMLDSSQIKLAIEDIKALDPDLSAALKSLASSFDYGRISDLLAGHIERKEEQP